MKEQVLDSILRNKVVAILRNVDDDKIYPTAEALYAGGIRLLEVTFNQSGPDPIGGTVSQIRRLCKEFEGRMYIGAGTVMTAEQVQAAKGAGASFIISPNVSRAVIEKTVALDMVSMPGAMTPTEIADAHDYGADLVKVFPASILGAAYVKAVRAPLEHIPLIAVGGIDSGNVAEFAKAGCCGFGIGGSLVSKKMIQSGNYDALTQTAKDIFVALQ